MEYAQRLMDCVQQTRPDLYEAILHHIRPHRLSTVLKLFERHLVRVVRESPDDAPLWEEGQTILHLFNRHRETLPEFCWQVIRHMKFPTPGDAYGIHLTCRVTQSDTQGTLDSKHLHQASASDNASFHVEKDLLDELLLFTSQLQVFEMANRHRFATVFLKPRDGDTVQQLLDTLPQSGHLARGDPPNKGRDGRGRYRYLSSFTFIVVEDRGLRVLYRSSRDLFLLLRHVPLDRIWAFSDVRYLFQKCGIVCYFFNMVRVAFRQLLWSGEPGSVYEKDVLTLIKYQCRSGSPLPLTRDGLAKNPVRSPLEVLSFEAPKKNYARLSTSAGTRDRWYEVKTSSDKIFFGQQFNEGTGYCFAVMPKPTQPAEDK